MPSPHAHAHSDEGDDVADLSLRNRPIDLVDIARVLGQSANIERLGQASIRTWRDVLTSIRESLSYARAILAADVAILSHSGSAAPSVDQLSSVLAGGALEDALSGPADQGNDPMLDEDLFMLTDHLLAAHRAMARVDLSSAVATAGVRAAVEEQLALLTERQAAVEARLQQIRAVIIRRYREDLAPPHDKPA